MLSRTFFQFSSADAASSLLSPAEHRILEVEKHRVPVVFHFCDVLQRFPRLRVVDLVDGTDAWIRELAQDFEWRGS